MSYVGNFTGGQERIQSDSRLKKQKEAKMTNFGKM